MPTKDDSLFPIQIQANSGLSFAWREYVPRDSPVSPWKHRFAYRESQATLVIDINWEDIANCTQQLLGVSKYVASPGAGFSKMSRTNPWPHPYFPWLYCTKISEMEGIGFTGKYPNPAPNASPLGNFYGAGPFGTWEYCRLTLLFEGLDYPLVTDSNLRTQYGDGANQPLEWWRNVTIEPKPGLWTLTRNRGDFTWTGEAGGPPAGQSVDAGISQILPRATHLWTWHLVPSAYVLDGRYNPANVMAMVGKVNHDVFPPTNPTFPDASKWFQPGTLLFHAPEVIWETAPFPPQVLGFTAGAPSRLVTLKIPVTVFDPPAGIQPPSVNSAKRGHNTAPFAGDNKWWPVVSNTTGAAIYESGDASSVFAPIS